MNYIINHTTQNLAKTIIAACAIVIAIGLIVSAILSWNVAYSKITTAPIHNNNIPTNISSFQLQSKELNIGNIINLYDVRDITSNRRFMIAVSSVGMVVYPLTNEIVENNK